MADPQQDDAARKRPGSSLTYRLAWAIYLVLAVVAALWIGLRDHGISASLFVSAEPLVDVGAGLAAALVLRTLWVFAERFFATARQLSVELSGLLGALDRSEVIALALLSGFAEELFFRGAVQGSIGWPAATIVFALLHTGPSRPMRLWGLFALLAGGVFGWLMLWRGGLLAPILAHALVNALGLHQLATHEEDGASADRR